MRVNFLLYMDLFYDNISWLIIRDTNEEEGLNQL